jgi:hypothetical protein
MPRYLAVKANVIRNIIDYPIDYEPGVPEEDENGNALIPEPAGTWAVGGAFDATDALNEQRLNRQDQVILRELFRLTNEVRVLNGQATITSAQYRTFIKTQL